MPAPGSGVEEALGSQHMAGAWDEPRGIPPPSASVWEACFSLSLPQDPGCKATGLTALSMGPGSECECVSVHERKMSFPLCLHTPTQGIIDGGLGNG